MTDYLPLPAGYAWCTNCGVHLALKKLGPWCPDCEDAGDIAVPPLPVVEPVVPVVEFSSEEHAGG